MTRVARLLCAAGVLGVVATLGAAAGPRATQTPRFRTSVEVTSLDVTVVDDRGHPIADLGPDAFVVKIDGKPRRVVTAEWISQVSRPTERAAVAPPEGFSTNENQIGGRIIVIAVDQPHIRTSGTQAILLAAGSFIDKLSPADRIAVVGFGLGGQATTLTADKERAKEALARLTGEKGTDPSFGQYNITLAEAIAITDHDSAAVASVVNRECPIPPSPNSGAAALQGATTARLQCQLEIQNEAAQRADKETISTTATTRGLHDLLERLRVIDEPKTIVLISEGFVLGDSEPFINEVGALAVSARASLYALQLDDESMFSAALARRSTTPGADARDRRLGLEVLTSAARGTLFTALGTGASFFDLLDAELSGYYLLGVESDPGDRNGRAHPVRIDVPQRKAIVRSHREIIIPADTTRSPRDVVAANLRSPILQSALPLSVAAFAFQDSEPGRVQMLIHADVGRDYSEVQDVAVGYTIVDRAGRIVVGGTQDVRLTPRPGGAPSALQFDASESVAPGEYTLKLAATDGRRTGSVEHPLHAALVDAGEVRLSELLAGGLAAPNSSLPPTVGYPAAGSVHGYVEAYGPRVETVAVRYEIAASPAAPPLMAADVPGRLAAPGRMIYALAMPVSRLPPGQYVLRATAVAAATPLKTLTRSFEVVAAAPVASTSTPDVASAPNASSESNTSSVSSVAALPAAPSIVVRPFQRDDALAPAVLQIFRSRLAPAVKTDFEAAVVSLKSGDYPTAEAGFKRTIRPDADSTAAMVYLAATFAAAGHDTEASAAWQTALVDGSDVPQIFEWLGQSLARSRRLAEARAILEEAAQKWPADPRFAWPLATVYAGLGESSLAFSALERHLSARPDDRDALLVGVEWIYQAHAGGRIVRGAADDLKLAHAYAEAYAKAGGSDGALVGRWIEFLDREKH
jgi:VWFA-related protein